MKKYNSYLCFPRTLYFTTLRCIIFYCLHYLAIQQQKQQQHQFYNERTYIHINQPARQASSQSAIQLTNHPSKNHFFCFTSFPPPLAPLWASYLALYKLLFFCFFSSTSCYSVFLYFVRLYCTHCCSNNSRRRKTWLVMQYYEHEEELEGVL